MNLPELCDCGHRKDNHIDQKYGCMVTRQGRPCECDVYRSQLDSKRKQEEREKESWPTSLKEGVKKREKKEAAKTKGLESWA
jgi:hypothetical protein